MSVIDIDREAAREAAEDELAKPIYPHASLSDRIAEWFNDLMFRMMTAGADLPGGWFTITVLGVLILAGALVAVRIARSAMGRGSDGRLYRSRMQSAAEHRARAEQSAAQGHWATAIRHRLRAIGRQLEEDGVLNAVPGRTAAELAEDTGSALPGFATELLSAAAIFDDVTYGHRPGTAQHYQLIADLDVRVRQSVGGHTGAGMPPR